MLTNVNIRTDSCLKKAADKLFKSFGMNMTTAINIFLRQSVYEHKIPFEISRNIPNEETVATLEKAEKGEDMIGPFNNIEDLMRSLDADD